MPDFFDGGPDFGFDDLPTWDFDEVAFDGGCDGFVMGALDLGCVD